jgi:signal peptidase I
VPGGLDSDRHATEPPARPAWRDFVDASVVALVLALFARTWVVQAYRVPSASMAPGLRAGDHIVVNKLVFRQEPSFLLPARAVRRGDVAVFRLAADPARVVVKRCVAVGGDQLRLVDKQLFVNGVAAAEPYATHLDSFVYPRSRFLDPPLRNRDNFGPLRVPDDHLFWLGDNRDESQDSRLFGSTPASVVIGQAVWIGWSRAGPSPDLGRGSTLARTRGGRLLRSLEGYLRSFRLGRIFRQIR